MFIDWAIKTFTRGRMHAHLENFLLNVREVLHFGGGISGEVMDKGGSVAVGPKLQMPSKELDAPISDTIMR